MSQPFILQIALWIAAAVLSGGALVQYFYFRRKELRLPQACEFEDLETRLRLKQKELIEVERSAGKAREVIGESQQKIGEVNEARAWLNSQKAELERIGGEREIQESLRASIHEQQEEKKENLATLGRLQQERAAETANLTNMATQKANLAAAVDQLKQQQAEIAQQIRDQTLNLNLVNNDLNLKSVDLKRLQSELEIQTVYLAKANEQFEHTIAENVAARRTLVEVETRQHALQQECLRLKAEIDDLNKWKETLTTMLQRLQANVDRMDPQATGLDRYRDLWTPCTFAPLRSSKNQIEEGVALTKTEKYLESHGLHYPRRVLHAFHTALKTADMSPLVVLAGISGTGKSLLPKRYAEAMGMHMVSLAVQPRWDSPQDLFGFFNLLEGRFKATELARALVQFERFNRKNWSLPKDWHHGREDRMLLILLDEMNLARVEYYFSEFLSRLETRRDVNEQDPSDRAKAEIQLDMGSLRDDERSIRLYPGRNVLFTGTMNEDESTQSLSDKVIDRACVLRFGRPQKLERINTRAQMPAREEGLSFDDWSRWCGNRLSTSDESTMNTWIAELNHGMDALGKPFAHRVHQAILSYAGHYPRSQSGNYLQLALADQIEQRILPKLRGVELEGNDEALETIRNVIEAAHDPLLLEAFQKAQDARSGTFHWRGLDRTEA